MNIAIVRHSIRDRGADRILFDYADHLLKNGHAVTYYTNERDTCLPFNPAIRFESIPYRLKAGTVRFTFGHAFREDIVLVDLIAMACLGWVHNRRKIVYLAQDYDVSYYTSPLMRFFIRACYALGLGILQIPTITESTTLTKTLKIYGGRQLVTVPNGVDLGLFSFNPQSSFLKEKKKARVIILFVREDHRKGMDIALKALKRLKEIYFEDNWKLWTIGQEPTAFAEFVPRHFGFVDELQLRDVLSAADIFLLPSRHEGLSTLLLQAMACECAVVATQAANILKDGINGLIAPSNNWEQLAGHLKSVLENNGLCSDFRLKARELAQEFDLQKSKQLFLVALEDFQSHHC